MKVPPVAAWPARAEALLAAVKRAIARMRLASRPTEPPRTLFSSLSPLPNHVALRLWLTVKVTIPQPRRAGCGPPANDYRLNNMRPHCAPNHGVLHRGVRR